MGALLVGHDVVLADAHADCSFLVKDRGGNLVAPTVGYRVLRPGESAGQAQSSSEYKLLHNGFVSVICLSFVDQNDIVLCVVCVDRTR